MHVNSPSTHHATYPLDYSRPVLASAVFGAFLVDVAFTLRSGSPGSSNSLTFDLILLSIESGNTFSIAILFPVIDSYSG